MPTYPYRCEHGHVVEAVRPIDRRDDPLPCPVHGSLTQRGFVVPQMIVRPWGYSLRPGDKGYWTLDSTGMPRPSASPFAMAEDFEQRPPIPVGDEESNAQPE